MGAKGRLNDHSMAGGQCRRALEGSISAFVACLAAVILLKPGGLGQARELCFAYLQRGDVHVECGGVSAQVTQRGNIEEFAVDGAVPSVGLVSSRIGSETAHGARVTFSADVVDLRSRQARHVVDGEDTVIATCGGIFWAHDANRRGSGVLDLLTNEQIRLSPYAWFRCSSDRRVVLGLLGSSESGIWVGFPPRPTAAAAPDVDSYQFDISPDGSKLVYTRSGRPLCVLSPPGSARCLATHDTLSDTPSINNVGEVLVATATPDECFYRSRGSFGRKRFLGATDKNRDACLAVGYWNPSLDSIEIVQPIARNPQWISPATAALLREWAKGGARSHD